MVPDDKREKKSFWPPRMSELLSRAANGRGRFRVEDVVRCESRGVVAGIIPSTNPTSTAIFKLLIAIKSRTQLCCRLIRRAKSSMNCRVMREAGEKDGLPSGAVPA